MPPSKRKSTVSVMQWNVVQPFLLLLSCLEPFENQISMLHISIVSRTVAVPCTRRALQSPLHYQRENSRNLFHVLHFSRLACERPLPTTCILTTSPFVFKLPACVHAETNDATTKSSGSWKSNLGLQPLQEKAQDD